MRVGGGEAAPAARIDFVEEQAAAGTSRRAGEQPGSGGRFENDVSGREPARASGKPSQRERRRKGLKGDLLLRAMGLGRERMGQFLDAPKGRGGIGLVDRRARPRNEQHLGEFERVIAVAQSPTSVGVGAAGRGGH